MFDLKQPIIYLQVNQRGDIMTSTELVEIGNRIAQRRKELNYTQEKIAEKMNVSIQMVSNLERGNKAIKIDNLIKISEILGISTDYILTGKHTDNDLSSTLTKLSMLSSPDYAIINTLIDYLLNRK